MDTKAMQLAIYNELKRQGIEYASVLVDVLCKDEINFNVGIFPRETLRTETRQGTAIDEQIARLLEPPAPVLGDSGTIVAVDTLRAKSWQTHELRAPSLCRFMGIEPFVITEVTRLRKEFVIYGEGGQKIVGVSPYLPLTYKRR